MNKLLIITGPTATGKTTLAVFLAKKFNGELVSVDSRQVFKGMDIGTGKDHPQGFPLHLIDLVEPDEKFSVYDYALITKKAIEKIWAKDKLPILVGGTGFYLKGLLEGIKTTGVEPDWGLRKKVEKIEIKDLQKQLKSLDSEKWQGMNSSDQKNPRRLVRSIEIAKAQEKKPALKPLKGEFLMVGLRLPFKRLYPRIDQRVEKRIKLGVEKEIRKLLKQGYDWENSVLGSTLGYQEWQSFFKKEASRQEVIEKWKFAEHAYARRQMTWFKKVKKINWFEIDQPGWEKKVEKFVKTWYCKFNAAKN